MIQAAKADLRARRADIAGTADLHITQAARPSHWGVIMDDAPSISTCRRRPWLAHLKVPLYPPGRVKWQRPVAPALYRGTPKPSISLNIIDPRGAKV